VLDGWASEAQRRRKRNGTRNWHTWMAAEEPGDEAASVAAVELGDEAASVAVAELGDEAASVAADGCQRR
jgi:hypothetical protein